MKQKLKFTYWQDDNWWLSYLDDFPDHWTQGETIEDLKVMLADIYRDLISGEIPGVRRKAEFEFEIA